jgi:hypothetical protein
MENLIILMMLIVLILVIFLSITNYIALKKAITKGKTKIGDKRYYELNNKIQMIIIISSMIVLIGGFLGYNTISSIKEDIYMDINQYQDKIDQYTAILDSNKVSFEKLNSELERSTQKANDIILELANNYLNVKTYLVQKLSVNNEKDATRLYFKDLTTSNGKKLPKFSKPPSLSIAGKGTGQIWFKVINKDYFEYTVLSFYSTDKKTGKTINSSDSIGSFDLLITYGL